jgi:glucuronate isomerase
MVGFIHQDFLLESEFARALYHGYAKEQPILDYHCHLSPAQIADNHRFSDLTEIWLQGDHYKWRALRANGVGERFITGDASAWEKFAAWAGTVPYTLRNPLYHWTHLELRFPFGIDDCLLNVDTARSIYDRCGELLARDDFRVQGLLTKYRVVAVCTTDDPVDDLEAHLRHRAAGSPGTRLFPTFRPDRALGVERGAEFNAWLEQLEARTNRAISTFDGLLEALAQRHEVFHAAGCRLSDHGLDTAYSEDFTRNAANATFQAARSGRPIGLAEARLYKSAVLHELALLDHSRGWTQQFHVGALRNVNTRMRNALGPDTGFDTIGDTSYTEPLARFLDRLDTTNQLAKTVLYNLNPKDNEAVAALAGCFQDGSIPGKIQFGSAWWFLDQLDGMEKQLNALSNLGLLRRFVGMLTDSRSFLSYSRHDYFRRLLCNLLGSDVERGRLPKDLELLGALVREVCFDNARGFFGLPLDG